MVAVPAVVRCVVSGVGDIVAASNTDTPAGLWMLPNYLLKMAAY